MTIEVRQMVIKSSVGDDDSAPTRKKKGGCCDDKDGKGGKGGNELNDEGLGDCRLLQEQLERLRER